MQVVGGAGDHESQVSTRFESYLLFFVKKSASSSYVLNESIHWNKQFGTLSFLPRTDGQCPDNTDQQREAKEQQFDTKSQHEVFVPVK